MKKFQPGTGLSLPTAFGHTDHSAAGSKAMSMTTTQHKDDGGCGAIAAGTCREDGSTVNAGVALL